MGIGFAGLRNKSLTLFLTALLTVNFSSVYASEKVYVVSKITDGDTINVAPNEKVRFVQIDSPELRTECYGVEARETLIKLLGTSSVTLQVEAVAGDRDQFKRLLRYVYVGTTNLNLRMVELGAAAPYFFKGQKGAYADQLLKAAQTARNEKVGLWGACPSTKLNPTKGVSTGPKKK